MCDKNKEILDFAEVELDHRYAVVEMREGTELDLGKYDQLMQRIAADVRSPLVLIFNDVCSYSITLSVLMALQQDARVCCFAVVAYRSATHNVYRFAQDVIGKQIRFFGTREQAVEGARQMLMRVQAA